MVALAIIGFAGIRGQEFDAVALGALDFQEKRIIVPNMIAKCEAKGNASKG
jgi:hypothetical protein